MRNCLLSVPDARDVREGDEEVQECTGGEREIMGRTSLREEEREIERLRKGQ